ncbi:MAG: hypothetical protein ABEJ79_07180 [Halolamina sp.]
MTGESRDRGILTDADRAYLRGERTYGSEQAERNARARIRDRVWNAALDFELLLAELDDHDRELVFGKRADRGDPTAVFDALVAATAFCYRAVEDTDLDFETVLREAINVAAARDDRGATVEFDVTYLGLDAEGLRRKLDRGEELSLTELAYLQESDEFGPREVAEYFGDDDPTDVDDGRIQSSVTSF